MNNIKQLKESQREAHPGFDIYLECMTRSLFTGLSAFVLSKILIFASSEMIKIFNLIYCSLFCNILRTEISGKEVALHPEDIYPCVIRMCRRCFI